MEERSSSTLGLWTSGQIGLCPYLARADGRQGLVGEGIRPAVEQPQEKLQGSRVREFCVQK